MSKSSTSTTSKKSSNLSSQSISFQSDENEARAEGEEVLRILESELGSSSSVMESFATTVKKQGTILKANAKEVIDMMHKNNNIICVDARTPKEYQEGHIPGAQNLPIFSNEERITVGTIFKQTGRSQAMTAGMDVVRPKFDSLLQLAQELVSKNNTTTTTTTTCSNKIIVHCWRGGMRSHALAYLLQTRGNFEQVIVLEGGYKAFRKWARLVFCYIPINASYNFNITDLHQHGKRKTRDTNKNNKKNKKPTKINKKKQAKLEKLSEKDLEKRKIAIEKGIEKRRLAIERKEQLIQTQNKVENDMKIAQYKKEEMEWNEMYTVGPPIIIVGGSSGSGKTRVLLAMKKHLNCQVIDLEGVANHNGSAFGFVGHTEQPTNQQYSNMLAVEWYLLDPSKPVYIEDEGSHIGSVNLPSGLYRLMRTTSVVVRLMVSIQSDAGVM